MRSKVIGSILMILGTSVGAGMLALPVASAHENFLFSSMMLVSAWAISMIGAFALLEVNLWLEPGTNIISMAQHTLGKTGQVIAWVLYLFLLYSLLCAYLSGLGDILQALLAAAGVWIPRAMATVLSLLLLGAIIYRGIGSVDMANRGLMFIKLLTYVILVSVLVPHIKLSFLASGDSAWRESAILVMITAFGYSIIIPSIRQYLDSNVQDLKRVVLIGSLIPLVIYLIWIASVQGVIPRLAEGGLVEMSNSAHTNAMLMHHLSRQVTLEWLHMMVRIFISICAVTSFLGVSLSITDFMADGTGYAKRGKSAFMVYGLSFGPPLLLVLLAPGIFIKALDYAGVDCVVLLIILPLVMLFTGRYIKHHEEKPLLCGGRPLLLLAMLLSLILLVKPLVM
jgi:tyrosine-specific transport protein